MRTLKRAIDPLNIMNPEGGVGRPVQGSIDPIGGSHYRRSRGDLADS
jgi:hypothetical protein